MDLTINFSNCSIMTAYEDLSMNENVKGITLILGSSLRMTDLHHETIREIYLSEKELILKNSKGQRSRITGPPWRVSLKENILSIDEKATCYRLSLLIKSSYSMDKVKDFLELLILILWKSIKSIS